jgi:hypothetical protein
MRLRNTLRGTLSRAQALVPLPLSDDWSWWRLWIRYIGPRDALHAFPVDCGDILSVGVIEDMVVSSRLVLIGCNALRSAVLIPDFPLCSHTAAPRYRRKATQQAIKARRNDAANVIRCRQTQGSPTVISCRRPQEGTELRLYQMIRPNALKGTPCPLGANHGKFTQGMSYPSNHG